ncbi:hypothetical protein RHS03_06648, partial [Rhizoctonia solani]
MASNLSAEKAAQSKKLCEQKASIDKMISSIAGTPKVAASLTDPLGMEELKGIASWQGVDLRFSLTKQPISQCVTNTVNKMVETCPEIRQKILDPDWFIRQTLQGLLKALGKSHWKQVNGTTRKQKPKKTSKVGKDNNNNNNNKNKNKDKDKGKQDDKEDKEDKNKDKDEGKKDKKREKGKGREEQEEDTEMSNVDKIPNQTAPQASASAATNKDAGTNQGEAVSSSNAFNSTPAPPAHVQPPMKKQLFVEELHTARDWSSPVQTPFTSGRFDLKNDVGNGDGPTPMPTKIQQIPPTKQPTKKALVLNYNSNLDKAEDNERTPKPPSFMLQTKKVQVFTKANNNRNQTLEHKAPGGKVSTEQPACDAPAKPLAKSNPTPQVTDSRAESCVSKRKAREHNEIPKAPVSKKGKATTTIQQTPACTFLAKNFKAPVPASPFAKAHMTQSQATQPPAASSSTLPPPPAAPKSKAEVRKIAAQKAAATQLANKLAKQAAAEVMAESSELKESTKRKK